MARLDVLSFKKGIEKIKNNPQLVYTIIIAVLISGAFILMSQTFISIANNAQERLINVRVGSIQDSFATFAGDNFNNSEYLNKKISDVVANNETIINFKIIEKRLTVNTKQTSIPFIYVISASNKPDEVGNSEPGAGFLYTLASSDPSNSITIQFNKDGERVFNTARAISDSTGKVVAVIMTTQTLSFADKAIEDSINRSVLILVAVILFIMFLFLRHSRIVDYTVLYKKLKEVDKLKDDFVSMASHELRTPLTIIRGYVDIIKDSPNLSDDAKTYADKIDTSAKDLDLLVGDILDVNKIEQGRMSFKFEEINPTDILSNVVSSLESVAKDKGLALSLDNKASEINIRVDKDRLKQVLVNIVGNAVKYTKTGEVKVRQYTEDNKLFVRVSDTGLGMSAEEQKRLFEKFYRVKNKDTEDIRGTGLGLWITSQIIKEMKGSISVESIKGVGSHFIISFPIV